MSRTLSLADANSTKVRCTLDGMRTPTDDGMTVREALTLPVSCLGLLLYSERGLERLGIESIGQLVQRTKKSLRRRSPIGLGVKSANEVVEVLAEVGLELDTTLAADLKEALGMPSPSPGTSTVTRTQKLDELTASRDALEMILREVKAKIAGLKSETIDDDDLHDPKIGGAYLEGLRLRDTLPEE